MVRFSLSSNQRYFAAINAVGVLVLVYVLINLFVIGGDGFVILLNSSITALLAFLTASVAFSLWSLVNTGRNSRLLWGGLLAGWASWAIAEILWLVFGYVYQEVPYPSLADFFWLIGYIPMGFALYSRRRELPPKSSQVYRQLPWAVSLLTVLLTVTFILIPILQSNDPSNWLESILNVTYPLADLVLLIIVIQLIVVYRGSDYGIGWSLLTAGFVLQPISDLLFSYASLSGLYYPDQKVNFLSSIGVDVPYTLSYLAWMIGLYTLQIALSKHKPFEKIPQPLLIPNTSILIFLKHDNTVISTSNNVGLLSDAAEQRGMTLANLLHIPQSEAQSIFDAIQAERKITDWPIRIESRSGISPEAYISGIATISPDGAYSGCNLLLRVLVEDDYSLDEELTQDQKYMISHLRKISGSSERDHLRRLLLDYHLAYLKQLYNLAFRTGGAQLSLALFEYIQQIDEDHQWHLRFHPESLVENDDYQISLLREALPLLLEKAKRFVSQLTDESIVEEEMQLVSSQFSEAVHANVRFYS